MHTRATHVGRVRRAGSVAELVELMADPRLHPVTVSAAAQRAATMIGHRVASAPGGLGGTDLLECVSLAAQVAVHRNALGWAASRAREHLCALGPRTGDGLWQVAVEVSDAMGVARVGEHRVLVGDVWVRSLPVPALRALAEHPATARHAQALATLAVRGWPASVPIPAALGSLGSTFAGTVGELFVCAAAIDLPRAS